MPARHAAAEGRRQTRAARLFLLALLLFVVLTHDSVFMGGNDASRFAQIESLVDHHQAAIDSSRYAWTTDRVVLDGRSYSNKPPLLAVYGAGVYLGLRTLGLSFATQERAVVYLLTLLVVGVPAAWLVSRFATELEQAYPDRPRVRSLTVLALAAGTLLTSFVGTFNHHTVAAALLFAAFVAARRGRAVVAGAASGLTAAVDLLPGAAFLPAIAYLVWSSGGRRALARAVTAIAVVGLGAAALDLWILGSPLPPLLVPGAVDQSGGKDVTGPLANIPMAGAMARPLSSLGAALFGAHGFLSVSPVLISGVVGALAVALGIATTAASPAPAAPTRREALALATAGTVLAVGHATLVASLGGWSYGYRYLIPLIPLLLFFAPAAVPERRAWLLAALVAISVPLALLGAYNPWPPVYEAETPGQGLDDMTNPVGVNLAALLARYAPDSGAAEWALSRFIATDPRIRDRYLYYFHRSKGDREASLQAYYRSLRARPDDPWLHYDLAEVLVGLDALEEAARHYAAALQLAPGFDAARAGLERVRAALLERRFAGTGGAGRS